MSAGLTNGDLAFRPVPAPKPLPIPAWYSAPSGSVRREPLEQRFFGNSLGDTFSSRVSEDAILAFYESCTAQGGLVRSADPQVGRAVSGFGAENAEYDFSIDLYRHKDLTFWTIRLHAKTAPGISRMSSLRLLKRSEHQVILQNAAY
jgi:hypothetical protein